MTIEELMNSIKNKKLNDKENIVTINGITIDSVETLKQFCLVEYETDIFNYSNTISDFLNCNQKLIVNLHNSFLDNIKCHNAICNLESIIEQNIDNIDDYYSI
jgi:hypothetical protein